MKNNKEYQAGFKAASPLYNSAKKQQIFDILSSLYTEGFDNGNIDDEYNASAIDEALHAILDLDKK